TGIIYQDRTLYEDVRKLPPATVFWFAEGTLKHQQHYWSCSELQPETLSGDVAISRLWESLTRAAQRIVRAFPQPVCDLTGGYDSRAMVAAFLSTRARFGTTVSGPVSSPDVVVSEGLASLVSVRHTHFPRQDQQPFAAIKDALRLTDG